MQEMGGVAGQTDEPESRPLPLELQELNVLEWSEWSEWFRVKYAISSLGLNLQP